MPFVLLFGRAAYLNVFWLAVWLAVLVAHSPVHVAGAVLGVAAFVFFPGVSITFLNGSDSFAQRRGRVPAAGRGPARSPDPRALAIASGVLLSSRFNVVRLLPVLAAVVVRRFGVRQGVVYGALTGVVWLAVSFAPWVVDPADCSPLRTCGMLGRFDSMIPRFGVLAPLATGVLAVLLARSVLRGGDAGLAMALVLSVPVLCGFLADVVVFRHLDLWPLVYGLMATPLWVGAAVPALSGLFREARRLAVVTQPPSWRLTARSASPRRS